MAKFSKGKSGNPAGRKPGTSQAAKLRQAIENDLPDIITSLVDAAKTGDTSAAKLLLDRAIPALRPITQATEFKLDSTTSLSNQAKQVMKAIADGELSPDTGSQMLSGLSGVAKIIETDELTSRLEKLEADYESQH